MLDHRDDVAQFSDRSCVCSGCSESVAEAAVWASWKIGCGFAHGVKPQWGRRHVQKEPGPGALLLGSRWWGRIWPGSASELVTLVVTTSPIPSHPSLVLLRTESASAMACPCNMASDMQAHLLYHIPDYIRLSMYLSEYLSTFLSTALLIHNTRGIWQSVRFASNGPCEDSPELLPQAPGGL